MKFIISFFFDFQENYQLTKQYESKSIINHNDFIIGYFKKRFYDRWIFVKDKMFTNISAQVF